MANILLVEPDYSSKFPPLGLLRLSAYHKEIGDSVTFTRGKDPEKRIVRWHRIYVSSLFTYELPRTVETIRYYQPSVEHPEEDIVVGGIGAILKPGHIRDSVECKVIPQALDKEGLLGPGTPRIDTYTPDYSLLDTADFHYKPENSYFCRVTVGCIRSCKFCAVPHLEPEFAYLLGIKSQICAIKKAYGERQNLVLLDNNILATDRFPKIINAIRDEGFEKGARHKGKIRTVDLNQGIDARLITDETAKLLASICLDPVRLAFDYDQMEGPYTEAIRRLASAGFVKFTNYVMFNYKDTPRSFYNRIRTNVDLSEELGVRVTGFPMRFVPIDDVTRRYVSEEWTWRYLRGIQCVLLATHGMVSPKKQFFEAAFGSTYEEFLEILSMPDRYIIHRRDHEDNGAARWKELFGGLSQPERLNLLNALSILNGKNTKEKKEIIAKNRRFAALLEHYFPGGETPHD